MISLTDARALVTKSNALAAELKTLDDAIRAAAKAGLSEVLFPCNCCTAVADAVRAAGCVATANAGTVSVSWA